MHGFHIACLVAAAICLAGMLPALALPGRAATAAATARLGSGAEAVAARSR
ncbi:hypothetical protein OG455_38135 [Kitasatospora sp. NBC_01287]|uniref:hypothetical protein n=1 Tax=Kitasatospora sp. NBC_01287 TaxID=2903573 RepID=UPI0022564B8C|nr:hypothetical protein [Kitasatospora sp. NBC_01287]MCX4751258.1 hypothetical protein [Kitasatospora sp. NBC_01287]